jgi:AraC-like DNA-binding protein
MAQDSPQAEARRAGRVFFELLRKTSRPSGNCSGAGSHYLCWGVRLFCGMCVAAARSQMTAFRRSFPDERDSCVLENEHRDGVRVGWACDLINACQAVSGAALDGDPTCLEELCDRMKRRVEAPESVAEAVFAGQSIALLLDRVGEILHRRFHERFEPSACQAPPAVLPHSVWPTPGTSLEHLLQAWCRDYGKWFHAHHSLPPALRAKELLQDRFAEPLTIRMLASAVGSNRSSLAEQFTAAFGIAPAEYLGRVRIRHGLRGLRASDASIDEVAKIVGYQSGAKFAARVQRSIGVTPAQARLLEEPQFEFLLQERVALHHPQPSVRFEIRSPDGRPSSRPRSGR